MSKGKSIFQRFMKQCETGDEHFDPDLKSHYYKTSFDKAFQAVIDMYNSDVNFTISSLSKERGEIAVHMNNEPKAFIVATVIQVRPFETAVDFMVSSDKTSLTGLYPLLKKLVLQFYSHLDKTLPLIGKR